ncbi:MAG: succinylglutamate desuccinylase/aspartoacylase family protein [Nanoarchaeota archaeon]
MKLGIVCCVHGNEQYGLEVVKQLPFPFFIGNKLAVEKNIRFIDCDLNRCFSGKADGNHEEKIAYYLTNLLKDFDYVIDLHSSSNACPMFGIITKPNTEKMELAKKLGLKKIMIMPEFFASGKALIDFVKCGISIEVGSHERKENARDAVDLINNFVNGKNYSNKIEIFEVFSAVPKEAEKILIENFQDVKKGQIIATGNKEQIAEFDFTAVLVGEESYKGILCLACKK